MIWVELLKRNCERLPNTCLCLLVATLSANRARIIAEVRAIRAVLAELFSWLASTRVSETPRTGAPPRFSARELDRCREPWKRQTLQHFGKRDSVGLLAFPMRSRAYLQARFERSNRCSSLRCIIAPDAVTHANRRLTQLPLPNCPSTVVKHVSVWWHLFALARSTSALKLAQHQREPKSQAACFVQ